MFDSLTKYTLIYFAAYSDIPLSGTGVNRLWRGAGWLPVLFPVPARETSLAQTNAAKK